MNTNNYTSAVKIFISIWSPTDEAKTGVLSLTHKIDKKTLLDAFREIHLKPRKKNLN